MTCNTPNTALYIATVSNSLSFSQYRSLAEWLTCYKYISPDERFISSFLPAVLLGELLIKHTPVEAAFRLSEVMNILHSTSTIQEQNELLEYYYSKHSENPNEN